MGWSPNGLSRFPVADDASVAIGSGVAGEADEASKADPAFREPDDGAGIVAPPKLKEHAWNSRKRSTPARLGKKFREEKGTGFIFSPWLQLSMQARTPLSQTMRAFRKIVVENCLRKFILTPPNEKDKNHGCTTDKESLLAISIDRVCDCLQILDSLTGRIEMAQAMGTFLLELDTLERAPFVYLVQGQLAPPFRGGETGMSTRLVLRAIGLAVDEAGISLAVPPEKRLEEIGDMGNMAEDVLAGRRGNSLSFLDVFRTLENLALRGGVGSQEEKVRTLANLFLKLSPLSSRFVARFVVGKLRLGVGDATIIDALAYWQGGKSAKDPIENGYNLCSDLGRIATILGEEGLDGVRKLRPSPGYPIRMALCERLSSGEEIFDKIGACAVESKYDGFRCQIHSDGNRVQLFSRNLEETTPMFPEIVEATRTLFGGRTAIFEGEALGYNPETGGYHPFQVTITRKRKHNVKEKSDEIPLKMLVFDLMYLDGESWLDTPFLDRRRKIESLFPTHTFSVDEEETAPAGVFGTSRLIVAEHPSTIDHFFDEVLEEGFEGIIAKRMTGTYTAGSRNFNWIKLKRSYKNALSDTLDLVIIGFYRGKGQRTKLGIGAILTATYDKEQDRFVSIARIGSGLTENQWISLRAMLEESVLSGKPHSVLSDIAPDYWVEPKFVIRVRADDITRSPQHTCGRRNGTEGYALRFPRITEEPRADKNPFDATTVPEIEDIYRKQKILLARHRSASPREKK